LPVVFWFILLITPLHPPPQLPPPPPQAVFSPIKGSLKCFRNNLLVFSKCLFNSRRSSSPFVPKYG